MRAKEFIVEVPIDVFQTVGDFDQPGSIDEPSRKLVTDPKAVKKIRNIFEKTPYTFNFYIINATSSIWNKSRGIYSSNDVIESLPDLEKYLKKDKNAISVVYTTNFTNLANYVPMTGWILAHRIGHIFHLSKSTNSAGRELFFEIEADLYNLLLDINHKVYGLDLHNQKLAQKSSLPGLARAAESSRELLHSIATMRSARNQKLRNNLDWGAEFLAQYLIGGGIKFNPLPDQNLDKPANENKESYNKLIQKFSKTTTNKFTKLFDSMIGSVFVL